MRQVRALCFALGFQPMKTKLKHLVLLIVVILAGCVTGERMSQLQVGMSKSQVIAILGKNDGYASVDGNEILKYSNRLSSGWSHDRADYNVVLKDGSVVEYGAGEVRSKGSGVVTIIPLKGF